MAAGQPRCPCQFSISTAYSLWTPCSPARYGVNTGLLAPRESGHPARPFTYPLVHSFVRSSRNSLLRASDRPDAAGTAVSQDSRPSTGIWLTDTLYFGIAAIPKLFISYKDPNFHLDSLPVLELERWASFCAHLLVLRCGSSPLFSFFLKTGM